MPYLIDGHNLIPKLGLRLDELDDEMELIAILQEYCRMERKKQVEVFFDKAPTSNAGTRKLGTVTAHFIPETTIADNAIRKRLNKLGKSARNWIVVSSDRQVQTDARAVYAGVISSEAFAKSLKKAQASVPKPASDRTLSNQEVDEWLQIFSQPKKK